MGDLTQITQTDLDTLEIEFFVTFFAILLIFTIYALLSRFTFCRDLPTFSAIFFGQNSLLRNITRFLHVCPGPVPCKIVFRIFIWRKHPHI